MGLPVRATMDDISQTCSYIAQKPTGATTKDITSVVGDKLSDSRRISALQYWGLIELQEDGKYKITDIGRLCARDEAGRSTALQDVIRQIPAYYAIIERAAHRREDSISSTDVSAHWHRHFKSEVGDSDDYLKQQTISFFQVAEGAGLGNLILGRRGAQTRFSFKADALRLFIEQSTESNDQSHIEDGGHSELTNDDQESPHDTYNPFNKPTSGQGIFIAHGKNRKPLEQLKKVLEKFRIPFKVAIDEPNLGRPISGKVRETMQACNCAILLFTADEEFKNAQGETIWRPSENVIYELGASAYLYDNRLVIMKEDRVTFPSNFHDIGYISFQTDSLEAKATELLSELIGFGIVKITT
ncbi:nucleotide-binding protein [bacterium]|nr:nucleotide-binding protein [bacterium]